MGTFYLVSEDDFSTKLTVNKNCIPVGCVPSAAVAVSAPGGGGGVSARGGVCSRGGAWSGGCLLRGRGVPGLGGCLVLGGSVCSWGEGGWYPSMH